MAFWRVYYHLVWATKNREYLIHPEIEKHLFPYLVSKATELGVYVYALNGWYDHIHLIVAIPPKLAVADVVKKLKGASAHFLNHTTTNNGFGWQRGYGVLSIGERQRKQAEAYVNRQKEHHQNQTTMAWLERHEAIVDGPNQSTG